MDEGLLNDLLECSVCLERLDTSSRVLPCQHTFCLKCLKVIVESHKELRCPECRVLVEAKVEELPPNVLLMRILEGMKNSAPRKLAAPATRHRSAHSQGSQQGSTPHKDKQLPPHARAMHDYISKEPGDLSFKKGETILLQKKVDAFWYQGETGGRSGMFPITYVQVIVPLPTPTALCKALYDFRMSAPDEEGCLAFDKGAIITVHRRVDENWAEGRLDQRVGIFPIAFVELNQPARQLMNSPPLNRAVPPPTDARANISDHRHHAQHSHRYQPMSMSTPATQTNYQNIATMSQSQPNYQQAMLIPAGGMGGQQQGGGSVVGSPAPAPRNILEPAHTKQHQQQHLIHLNMHNKVQAAGTVGLQSVSINHDRLRLVKYDYNSTTPVHKAETYQNMRTDFPVSVANFNANNVSSDSSSSVNTASAGSTTTPNSSNTSSSDSNPSLPSSPDNGTSNATLVIEEATAETLDASLDTSMGVLSLNESSTATNTSLNVSLPPAESPKPIEASQESPETRLDAPSSSLSSKKVQSVRNGPDSLLTFGLGLQAALSPSHGKEPPPRQREPHPREKRHSLTPSSHLQNHTSQNRHSAEIVATSLLDAAPRDRRRRSRSNERPLPCAYVALYPYKPHKPDELELHKGAIYTVTERCRDGWYKGCSERSQRCGVFPGNYVAPAPAPATHHTTKHDKSASSSKAVCQQAAPPAAPAPAPAPAAPPRTNSPLNTGQTLSYPWCPAPAAQSAQPALTTPRTDKQSREKSKTEKSSISGVSLMKRLAAMKKCKSPPPAYSMDNPVFEDTPPAHPAPLDLLSANTPAPAPAPGPSLHAPQHVRSGSCPSQLLRAISHSERVRHKERPSLRALTNEHKHRPSNLESPWQTQHRKSQSLDVTAVTRRDRHHTQVKERFRCIVPYPPNSEFELELKMDDIVVVSKKRGDGWYKGTLQRTGRSGLFPASFVQRCPQH